MPNNPNNRPAEVGSVTDLLDDALAELASGIGDTVDETMPERLCLLIGMLTGKAGTEYEQQKARLLAGDWYDGELTEGVV